MKISTFILSIRLVISLEKVEQIRDMDASSVV